MPTPLFRLFCVAAIAASGAAHAGVLELPQAKHVPECHGEDGNSLECARGVEKAGLAKFGPESVFRKGDTLRIRAANKWVVLKDSPPDSPSGVTYSYVMPIPALSAHLVHAQLYEGEGFLLVHAKTGAETFLDSVPVAAPGNKLFLSISNGLENPYSDNRITVLSVSATRFAEQVQFALKWGPGQVEWAGPHRARIAKTCWSDASGDIKPCGSAILQQVAGQWQLRD